MRVSDLEDQYEDIVESVAQSDEWDNMKEKCRKTGTRKGTNSNISIMTINTRGLTITLALGFL